MNKVEKTCLVCSKVFYVMPSRAKYGRGKHCSPECQHASRRAAPKNLVELTCIGCGASFTRNPSQTRKTKGAGKYCTRACRDIHWRGKLNPLWQGGDGARVDYGDNWQAAKRAARNRDGKCRRCGATSKLDVHHVIPIRLFENKYIGNDLGNLITLCKPCHRTEEARFRWVQFEDGSVLQIPSGGIVHELAREKGLMS